MLGVVEKRKKHVSGSACFTFLAADLCGRKTTAVLEVLSAEAEGLLHNMNVSICLPLSAEVVFLLLKNNDLKNQTENKQEILPYH